MLLPESSQAYQKSRRPTVSLSGDGNIFFFQRYILKHTHVSNDKLKFGVKVLMHLVVDVPVKMPQLEKAQTHRLQCTGHLYSTDTCSGTCSRDNTSFGITAMTAAMCANTRDGWLV